MKVYLASRFADWLPTARKANELRTLGLEVVSRWHDDASDTDPQSEWAERDYNDVRRCDILVAFTQGKDSVGGGRHTELGMALAWGKVVLLVGKRRQVFHHHPDVQQFDTWAECREQLALLAPTGSAAPRECP